MLRNAASKVMWGGRATVFMVGLAMIVALLLGGLLAPPAHAFSTFTVNTRSDHPPGLCLPLTPGEPSFDCTLREAINHANNNSNPTETDIIHFAIPDNP